VSKVKIIIIAAVIVGCGVAAGVYVFDRVDVTVTAPPAPAAPSDSQAKQFNAPAPPLAPAKGF